MKSLLETNFTTNGRKWGYPRKELKEVVKTRLASMDAAEAKRIPGGGGDMDTSGSVNGRRELAPVGGVIDSDFHTQLLGWKCCVRDFQLAWPARAEVVKEHSQ